MKKIFSILALLLMTAVGATAQTTYTVTVKDGTEDAARWSADPIPAGEGQTVTIKYNGTKKVKRVTAARAASERTETERDMGTSDPPKKAAALRQPTEASPAGAESFRGGQERHLARPEDRGNTE